MKIARFTIPQNVVKEIGAFTILWNQFEDLYCEYNCNPNKIKRNCADIQISAEAMRNLAEVLQQRCKMFSTSEYVKYHLHPYGSKESTEEDLRRMENFIDQQGEYPIIGCLLVINRIRNNLLHGLKSLEGLKDQKELFQAANAVLNDIIVRRI